jgi:hypothetical protein
MFPSILNPNRSYLLNNQIYPELFSKLLLLFQSLKKRLMWSTLRDAKVRCKNRWSEAHTSTIQRFVGECLSLQSKIIFIENAKKFLWIFWRHFREKEVKTACRRRKNGGKCSCSLKKSKEITK